MPRYKKYFSDIYDKYVEKIYRFVFLKVGTQDVAEDLTSEVFTRTWQKIRKDNAIENINAFLYQVARNLVTDYYRAKGRAQLVSIENVTVADAKDLQAKAATYSDFEKVKAALSVLKDEYREIITWYYLDEFSISEIAKMTRKSEDTVRVIIHRAMQALKEGINWPGTA